MISWFTPTLLGPVWCNGILLSADRPGPTRGFFWHVCSSLGSVILWPKGLGRSALTRWQKVWLGMVRKQVFILLCDLQSRTARRPAPDLEQWTSDIQSHAASCLTVTSVSQMPLRPLLDPVFFGTVLSNPMQNPPTPELSFWFSKKCVVDCGPTCLSQLENMSRDIHGLLKDLHA